MATGSSAVSAASDQEATFGLDANIASALSYFPVVGFIVLLAEDSNEFVRFHAAQSVATFLAVLLVRFGASFVGNFLPSVIALLWGLVMMVINLGILAVLVFLAYKAYSRERYELPVVSDLAEWILDVL